MIRLKDILKENGKEGKEDYPPYIFSPLGFGCHVCEYYFKHEEKHMCNNKEYIKYMGTSELINPKTGEQIKDPSKWCSNWFEPKPIKK